MSCREDNDVEGFRLYWYVTTNLLEARWPHGQCVRSRIERSGFKPWPGTLCCVLGQDTLLSQCLSSARCIDPFHKWLPI